VKAALRVISQAHYSIGHAQYGTQKAFRITGKEHIPLRMKELVCGKANKIRKKYGKAFSINQLSITQKNDTLILAK